MNALTAGENVDLTDGGLKTRRGMSITHPNSSAPNSEIRVLKQVLFPSTEATYFLAQTKGKAHLKWTAAPDGPERAAHTIVYDVGNARYLMFGGESSQGLHNDLWQYDPHKSEWSELVTTGTRPSPRFGHVAAYNPADECMYVHGGYDGAPLEDMYKLDCNTLVWSEIALSGTTPGEVCYHACCLIDANTLMIIGGRDSNPKYLDVYYDVNLTTGLCSELLTSGVPPGARYGHTLVYDGANFCYVVAGSAEDFFYSNAYKLSRTSGTWERIADLPDSITNGLAYHKSFYCSGYVICFSGSGQVVGSVQSAYQVYDVSNGEWTQIWLGGDIGVQFRMAAAMSDDGTVFAHGGETADDQFVSVAL
jgi:N-acetylneuraminic acid mutarotase